MNLFSGFGTRTRRRPSLLVQRSLKASFKEAKKVLLTEHGSAKERAGKVYYFSGFVASDAVGAYDFLDFGASKGGSIEFAKVRLGGNKGLGVDIDIRKAEKMANLGYDCLVADITMLELPPSAVRFVTMMHVLEHLAYLGAVRQAIECAAHVASDFLFISGPWFDSDAYLKRLGLKLFWSDWTGHPCHLTSADLQSILLELGLRNYEIMACARIKDSSDQAVHPIDSPRDQHDYVPGLHPPKPFVAFDRPVFREIVCCVRLRPVDNWKEILKAKNGVMPLPRE